MYHEISMNELALKTVEAVLALGVGIHSAWNEYSTAYLPVVKLHSQRGKERFDRETATEYARSIEGRIEYGEISWGYYKFLKNGLKRLTEFHDTGHN